MHLATSTGYGIYLIMWLPCLFLVAGIGFLSLIYQIRSGKRAEALWKWQPWTLVLTAGIAIMLHCVGYNHLADYSEATNLSSWEDGMKVIRFVDIGYGIILGLGVLLLAATVVIRRSHKINHASNRR